MNEPRYRWGQRAMFALAACLTVAAGAETANEDWATRYPGPIDDDEARDVAVSANGDVFITGRSLRSTVTYDYDYITIKYSAAGVQQWAVRYNSAGDGDDEANAIVVDAAGDCFVTGCADGDCLTIKYNGANGSVVWSKTYPGGCGNDIALEFSEGNVFVAGEAGSNALVIRYNDQLNGQQVWAKTDTAGEAYALDVSPAGHAYIAGETGGSPTDYMVAKYDFVSGTRLWLRTYDQAASTDIARDIVVDVSGNCYVTGESRTAGTNYDIATIAWDAGGTSLWGAANVYNGAYNGIDKGSSIALTHFGNVVVTGYISTSSTGKDIPVIKYSGSTGALLWDEIYDHAGADDRAEDIATDGAYGVYVTGYARNASGDDDYLTLKYDFAGDFGWTATYPSAKKRSALDDQAAAIAVDAAGYVYVTGRSDGVSGYDCLTIRYSQPPDNDACEDAEELAEGQVAFDTTQATFDGGGDCMVGPNLWYWFTAPCDGTAVVSLCGSAYDTKLGVYEGTGCPTELARMIACNDDYDCGGVATLQSQVEIDITAGETYLVEVGGFAQLVGEGVISLEFNCGDPCPWDTAPEGGDDTVGLGDLNALLSNWGPCAAPCLWDFAPEGGDGTVGLGDLNALLSNWGPCPE